MQYALHIAHDVDLSIHLHYISGMKTTAIQIRVNPSEKDAFDQAAALAGISLSSWARMTLRRAAMREFEDAGKRVDFTPERERVRHASD